MKKWVIFLGLILGACGPHDGRTASTETSAKKPVAPKPPSRAEAKAILEASPDLGDFQFTNADVTIPMKRSAMNEVSLGNAKQLASAGYLRLDHAGISLTGNVTGDPRFLVRPNGFLEVVPVVKKVMGDVLAVRPTAEGADCDFTWQWTPTEVGKAFKSGPVAELSAASRQNTVTMIWDGSRWTVLRIR